MLILLLLLSLDGNCYPIWIVSGNSKRNISNMRIFSLHPTLHMPHGYGKVSNTANPLWSLGRVCRSEQFHYPIWTIVSVPTIPTFKPSPKFPQNKELPSLLISDLNLLGSLHWNILAINSLFDFTFASEILKIHITHSLSPRYLWTPCLG